MAPYHFSGSMLMKRHTVMKFTSLVKFGNQNWSNLSRALYKFKVWKELSLFYQKSKKRLEAPWLRKRRTSFWWMCSQSLKSWEKEDFNKSQSGSVRVSPGSTALRCLYHMGSTAFWKLNIHLLCHHCHQDWVEIHLKLSLGVSSQC